jgi:hypothetical protein
MLLIIKATSDTQGTSVPFFSCSSSLILCPKRSIDWQIEENLAFHIKPGTIDMNFANWILSAKIF